MRLLRFEEKPDEDGLAIWMEEHQSDIPPYAILSHRWGRTQDEFSFQNFTDPKCDATSISGFQKMRRVCRKALMDGYSYAWMDTCCIDKSSSAELSEAINSMYRWYGEAQVCYAYLDDVRSDEDPNATDSTFRRSQWFTRGWTLQELIAPRKVRFFAADWREIGTSHGMAELLKTITGVSKDIIKYDPKKQLHLWNTSVAKKMSWAAGRVTTRPEDRAYSLMGLFDVNMPIMYGEGTRAFTRLQEEIIRTSTDQTIFAWQSAPGPGVQQDVHNDRYAVSEVLASSPDVFAQSSQFKPTPYHTYVEKYNIPHGQPDYAMTNAGLRMQIPLLALGGNAKGIYIAFLACSCAKNGIVWIYLQRTSNGNVYVRKRVWGQSLGQAEVAPAITDFDKLLVTESIWIEQYNLSYWFLKREPFVTGLEWASTFPVVFKVCHPEFKIVDWYPQTARETTEGLRMEGTSLTHWVIAIQHRSSSLGFAVLISIGTDPALVTSEHRSSRKIYQLLNPLTATKARLQTSKLFYDSQDKNSSKAMLGRAECLGHVRSFGGNIAFGMRVSQQQQPEGSLLVVLDLSDHYKVQLNLCL